MELKNPKPRHGHGTYRIGDSDDLVLVENVTWIPSDKICTIARPSSFSCTLILLICKLIVLDSKDHFMILQSLKHTVKHSPRKTSS